MRKKNWLSFGLDKPYSLGCRDVQKYNLKSKRWKGIIQVPDDAWFEHKKKEREGEKWMEKNG